MQRGRAFRRHQLRKAKRRARNLWVHVWQATEPIGDTWSTRMGYRPCEPTPKWVGTMASTHCKPCSCSGCGHQRHHEGPTIQERRAFQKDWEPWEALDPNRTAQPRSRKKRTKAEILARRDARCLRLKERDERFARYLREVRSGKVA